MKQKKEIATEFPKGATAGQYFKDKKQWFRYDGTRWELCVKPSVDDLLKGGYLDANGAGFIGF